MDGEGSDRENFERWFGEPLEILGSHPHSGFASMMISFPILERYLRNKTGHGPDELEFQSGLAKAIPELGNSQSAKTFWLKYRHTLLHYGAFQQAQYGFADANELILILENGDMRMNPELFARRVLEIVRSDFGTFMAGKVRLPRVQKIDAYSPTAAQYGSYWGTSVPPRQRR